MRSVVKGEMSAKTTHSRSAKGPTSIGDCSADGKFVTLENTGRKVRLHVFSFVYVFSFFIILFCLVPCGRLSWLLVSFWAHVNIVHHHHHHLHRVPAPASFIGCSSGVDSCGTLGHVPPFPSTSNSLIFSVHVYRVARSLTATLRGCLCKHICILRLQLR